MYRAFLSATSLHDVHMQNIQSSFSALLKFLIGVNYDNIRLLTLVYRINAV